MNEARDGSIGSRIKARMAAHKPDPLEKIDIAAVTRVSTHTVTRWLADVSKPSAENLPPLARVLGVPIFWLLTGHFETNAAWLADGDELEPPAPLTVAQIQEAAKRFTLDQWVEARRAEGITDEDIGRLLYAKGKRVAPTVASVPPVVGRVVPLQSADLARDRPDVPEGPGGRERRDRSKPRPPRNPDEEPPT